MDNKKTHNKRGRVSAALLALLVVLAASLISIPTPVAYADDYKSTSELLAHDTQQTANPVAYALTSEDGKLANSTWRAYKLMSAEYTQNGAVVNTSISYAPGITPELLASTGYDGTTYEGTVYSHYEGKDGTSASEYGELLSLANAITVTPDVLSVLITCDGDAASLPGSGLYLLVMEGYSNVGERDEHIDSPFIVVEANDKKNEAEVPLVWQKPDLSIEATMSKKDPYGSLTAIYQPKNAPQAAQEASGDEKGTDAQEGADMPAESTTAPPTPIPLPVIIVAGGIVAYVAYKKLKRHGQAPKTSKGETIGEGSKSRDKKNGDEQGKQSREKNAPGAYAAPEDKPLSGADEEPEVVEVSSTELAILFGDGDDE